MKSFLKRTFGKLLNQARIRPQSSPSSIEPGQAYAFQTRPYFECSPAETHRFAAIKILAVNSEYVIVGVLDGIWPDVPSAKDIRSAPIINECRFAYAARVAVFGVVLEWWKPEIELNKFSFVGTLPISRTEQTLVNEIASYAPGSRFSKLRAADQAAEGEWRWANDQEAFVSEFEEMSAKHAAQRTAEDERKSTRLSKLTWEQLQSETPFESWAQSPPYPPKDFTEAARATIRSACDALKKLGPKPRKADVRAVLKATVMWFNEADGKAGGVIETEERDDIYAVLEEIAYVTRQKVLVEEIDEWRTW